MTKKVLLNTIPWCRQVLMVSLLCLFFGTIPLFAEKTDQVVIVNGDRITGEIKKLERGQLEFKTDDMGWIYIDWRKVIKISSINRFDVELDSGIRGIGSIQEAEESGKMIVLTDEGPVTLDILSVVRISPIKATLRDRLKGYVDMGFNLEKANQLRTLTLGAQVISHNIKWETKADGNAYVRLEEIEETSEKITRHSLSLQVSRLMKNRWQTYLMGRLEHNSELELDLRSTIGVGMGRYVIQTNNILLLLMGGGTVTNESWEGEEKADANIEALGGLSFHAFRYDHPKLDSTVDLYFHPSITDFGRIRIEFKSRVRYEIFKDFFITLSVFDHFDSRPGGEGESNKNDYGVDTTITFQFK